MASRVDSPEEELIGTWIWEYVLKFSSDATLVRALTKSFPFPNDSPHLKQMVLITELSSQVSKDLDVQKTLGVLESLQHSFEHSFEDPEAEEAVLSKRFKPSTSEATKEREESVWKKGLREPTLELKEVLRRMLLSPDADADAAESENVSTVVSKLSALIENAWVLFGPVYLEKAEAAVMNGKYKPQGVWIPLNNVASPNDSGDKACDGVSVEEVQMVVDVDGRNQGASGPRDVGPADDKPCEEDPVQNVGKVQRVVVGRNEALHRAVLEKALAESRSELDKLVQDPLPHVLSRPGVVRRSLMDPHPSARAQVWDDEEDEIEESPSPPSPSASRRVRLPPLRSSSPFRAAVSAAATSPVVVVKQRRQKKKWSEEEVEILKEEVQKYGKGRWKMILQMNKEVFQGRTEVDLKDKWRNLEKYNFV